MLRKRSRAVSGKQGLISEHSSLFTSTRIFHGFFSKCTAGLAASSILEKKPFSAIRNLFLSRNPTTATFSSPTVAHQEKGEPIGLGLLHVLINEDSAKSTCSPDKRMVVFGSQLKIQVPSPTTDSSSAESVHSPSQLVLHSPARRSPSMGFLPLFEDYACVIFHWSNPRTTHMFDACTIGIRRNERTTEMSEKSASKEHSGYAIDDFLSFCDGCRKRIGPREDIYMYRGEKAFCSYECRYQEMMFDQGRNGGALTI